MADLAQVAQPDREAVAAVKAAFRSLPGSFGAHLSFFVLCAAYIAAYLFAASTINQGGMISIVSMFSTFMLVSGPILLAAAILIELDRVIRRERSQHPLADLAKGLLTFFTRDGRFARGLPLFLMLPPFMFVFAQVKALIPVFQPFAWDPAFDHLDRVMHFGRLPWEWLQPVLGFAPVTLVLNLNYNFWFLAMWIFLVHFLWVERSGIHRTRTLLAFFLTWVICGSLLAVLLSSAGPAFYGRLGLSPDPYAGLMAYLRAANEALPIWAVPVQDMLWAGYTGEGGLLRGISAMPSVHNASALLLVLAVWNRSIFVRSVAIAHAVLIFIGSIHLAWHYAVDSYLAWAVTLAIWWGAGAVARRWEETPLARNFSMSQAGHRQPA
ncbi:phosphatase PAP2 family protein [Taklimakanibacter lacteus]|uniref:phosphatase PAP2 family protein n=1 Tax=Taklimakanibacter lacteus TaxID=2268456 RepID=UPI0013C4E801